MSYADLPGMRVAVRAGVAVATIDIPPMNLIGNDLFTALYAFTEAAASDTAIRVVVFRSADPDFFIAHGDLEAEDDHVVFQFTMTCKTKLGRDYINDYLFLVKCRDGKVAHMQEYWDSKQAYDLLLA
jgi:enoyl-CoA hydratase/carnithine racemase